RDHKTLSSHGSVNVIFNASLYRYTKIYIQKFRNRLADVNTDKDSPVFLTSNQKKMKSSQVETSMGGATAFRKAAVSAVHEQNEDLRGDLADLMVHKQSTADHYYLLKNKGKSAVRTSNELAKIMRSSGQANMEENTDTLQVENPEQRHKWTPNEILELGSAFSEHIKRKSITLRQVKEITKGIPILRCISLKKICDKIRSYFGTDESRSEKSPSLPGEMESCQEHMERAGLTKCMERAGITKC
ncbi:uncharacterized protein LOC114537140, partial [Dendronephthya gigantea]|uniref:uncharacterized protein LOC114537140 n=1 Tax=Dendronephthya gigantea TaxID=151771 RepID=UPI001069900D